MSVIERTPPLGEVVQRTVAAFEKAFGARPRWAAQAPGRVNLIGEHTDYNEGFVLPIAIDRACVCVGGPAGDGDRSRLLAVDFGEVVEMNLRGVIVPVPPRSTGSPPWANYIVGVLQHFRVATGFDDTQQLDLAVSSSVPLGSGLSSSASLEVAVATMLEEAAGERLTPLLKVLVCQQAEHEYAGVPCGIMDQYAAVFGEAGHALWIDCKDNVHQRVPTPPESAATLLVCNTNVRHALASGEYAQRREACKAAAAALGQPSLGWLSSMGPTDSYAAEIGIQGSTSDSQLTARLTDEQQRLVAHVANEDFRTQYVAKYLRIHRRAYGPDGGSSELWTRVLRHVGRYFFDSHASLRDLYRVSCPELDTLVEIARGVEGVFGARMTGGGFGGCAIALVRPDAAERLAETWKAGFRQRHGRECTIFRVTAAHGAGPVELTAPAGD